MNCYLVNVPTQVFGIKEDKYDKLYKQAAQTAEVIEYLGKEIEIMLLC